jgi:hypothetical protein
MRTNQELYCDITKITMTIQKFFPELVIYITEIPMPDTKVTSPEIDNNMLKDYFETLKDLLFKYATNHNILINNF